MTWRCTRRLLRRVTRQNLSRTPSRQLDDAGSDGKRERRPKQSEKVDADEDYTNPSLVSGPSWMLAQLTGVGSVVSPAKVRSIVPVAFSPIETAMARGI